MDLAEEEQEPADGAGSSLFTRGVREIVPWPVEILDLPDPTEPELLTPAPREKHGAVATVQIRPAVVCLQPVLSVVVL